MDLLSLIVVLTIVGFCLWLLITYVPMPAPMPQVIVAIVVIILVLWVAKMLFGGMTLPSFR